MMEILENISVLTHSSIKINKEKVIYIDPYDIKENYNDADIIFITHTHFDHYSEADINKVKKEDTIYVAPRDVLERLINNNVDEKNTIVVVPNIDNEINIGNIKFKAVPAYNVNKQFHPKENGWVGYLITIDEIKYYIAGDTDITEENKKIKCDVAFVPVGGTYTMTSDEAAKLVNIIKPKIAIPIHYGSVVGTKEDAIKFLNLLDDEITGKILIKH